MSQQNKTQTGQLRHTKKCEASPSNECSCDFYAKFDQQYADLKQATHSEGSDRREHTPTPWKSEYQGITSGDKFVCAPSKEDAEFIVRAVNGYDNLAQEVINLRYDLATQRENVKELLRASATVLKMIDDGDLTTNEIEVLRRAIARIEGVI